MNSLSDGPPRRLYRLVREGHPTSPLVLVRSMSKEHGRLVARDYFKMSMPWMTDLAAPWVIEYVGLAPMAPSDYEHEEMT